MGARLSTEVPSSGSGRRQGLLNVDLNAPPPLSENVDLEGTSGEHHLDQAAQFFQQSIPPQLAPIDVDSVVDDDVVLSSPRTFAEAKNNLRRIHGRRAIDVDAEDSSQHGSNCNKRRRVAEDQQMIMENSTDKRDCVISSDQPPTGAPPPREELKYDCPICMGPLVEEMTTRCGHIFCKPCIQAAIRAQKKCPTCRRKVTMRSVFRIYLPASN